MHDCKSAGACSQRIIGLASAVCSVLACSPRRHSICSCQKLRRSAGILEKSDINVRASLRAGHHSSLHMPAITLDGTAPARLPCTACTTLANCPAGPDFVVPCIPHSGSARIRSPSSVSPESSPPGQRQPSSAVYHGKESAAAASDYQPCVVFASHAVSNKAVSLPCGAAAVHCG